MKRLIFFFILLFFCNFASRGMSINDLFKLKLDILDGRHQCEIVVKNGVSYYHYKTKVCLIIVNNKSSHILYFNQQTDKTYLIVGNFVKYESTLITPCYVFALLDKNMNIKRQIRTPFTPDNKTNIFFEDFNEQMVLMPYFMTKYVVKDNVITHEQGNVLPKSFWINSSLSNVFACLDQPVSKKNEIKLKINYYSAHKKTMLSYGNYYFLKYIDIGNIFNNTIFPTEYY